ncbi:substrate-binding domain-containing protein [Streptomyces sp. NPDC008150]|uniref:sugar ABC transporter substrate-binding protein n=1 Tax=Streptomyces sp. NPDC008150 TaxID=3364816 RepID=UPI0036E74BD0
MSASTRTRRALAAPLVCVCLSLAGCSAESDASTTHTGPVRIGFVNGGTSEFHTCLQASVEDTAQDNLATATVANSGGSAARELANVKSMIAKKVDVIILQTVNTSALDADVDAAWKAGVPIFLTSLTPPEGNGHILGAAVSRLPPIGALDAGWVNSEVGGRATEVGVISGDGSASSDQMTEGFTEALDSNVHVAAQAEGFYAEDKAKSAASAMIQAHPNLDYVFVASEQMGFGVRAALDAAGAQDVGIVTVNGTDDGLKALKSGEFAATVSDSAMDLGALAVTNALGLLRKDDVSKIDYVPTRLVTKADADTAPLYCPS